MGRIAMVYDHGQAKIKIVLAYLLKSLYGRLNQLPMQALTIDQFILSIRSYNRITPLTW